MIKPAENEVPELTGDDMCALLYILIKMSGGTVRVKHSVFENKPKELPIQRIYDGVNKCWFFKVPMPKRKRGKIATPRRNIILPKQKE